MKISYIDIKSYIKNKIYYDIEQVFTIKLIYIDKTKVLFEKTSYKIDNSVITIKLIYIDMNSSVRRNIPHSK